MRIEDNSQAAASSDLRVRWCDLASAIQVQSWTGLQLHRWKHPNQLASDFPERLLDVASGALDNAPQARAKPQYETLGYVPCYEWGFAWPMPRA
jgi:hypothetical protein